MMEEWKEYKLGEHIHIKHGYAFKGEYFTEIENENILLTPGNFKIGGGFKDDKLKFYNGPIPNDYVLNIGDIIVTMTDLSKMADTLGYSAKVPNNQDKLYLHNQRIGLVELKNDSFDKEFIYWLMRIQPYQRFVAGSATGATVKHTSPNKIYAFKFKAPESKVTQHRIASILSAYDDLIENNLKRIKLLEEMAQNYFDNWYSNNTDYEETNLGALIGHEIGGGWGEEEQTGEFNKPAFVIRGTDIDELPNGKNEKVPFRHHKKSNLATRKLQDGDIIFEVSGGSSYEGVAKTLLVTDELLNQFNSPVMPASFCKLVRPAERKHSSFIFHLFRFLRKLKGTEVFEIRSASNIVNYNWTAFLKFQKVKKPLGDQLKELKTTVEPIYKQIYNLGKQNQLLKEARDILLPRLMTGMVDVDEIVKED